MTNNKFNATNTNTTVDEKDMKTMMDELVKKNEGHYGCLIRSIGDYICDKAIASSFVAELIKYVIDSQKCYVSHFISNMLWLLRADKDFVNECVRYVIRSDTRRHVYNFDYHNLYRRNRSKEPIHNFNFIRVGYTDDNNNRGYLIGNRSYIDIIKYAYKNGYDIDTDSIDEVSSDEVIGKYIKGEKISSNLAWVYDTVPDKYNICR